MRAGRVSMVSAIAVAFAVASIAFSATATAAPAWGPQRTVDTWAWSGGSSLARTADGDLLVLEATDFAQGGFATDHGPYMGVFARTSADRGATWSAPVRVSQGGKHADRAALAVSGGTSYAAWVTQRSYDHYDPSEPRVLFFRANPGGGWGKTVALTKKKGRIDDPSIAASGARVFVAWVDANTGQVRVARSGDGGKTFERTVIGKTSALSADDEGFRGSVSIGAAGNVVGVTWIASGSGAIKARVSTNRGKKWHDSVTIVGSLGAANGGTPSLRAWGDRLALAWTTPGGVFSRVWSKSWGPTRTIASFAAGATYKGGFDVEVVPSPGGRLGAVWSACRTSGCDLLSTRARVDVMWSDSGNGESWPAPSLVQGSVHADQQINASPAAVWLDGGAAVVGYTGRASGWTSYGLFLRVGP